MSRQYSMVLIMVFPKFDYFFFLLQDLRARSILLDTKLNEKDAVACKLEAKVAKLEVVRIPMLKKLCALVLLCSNKQRRLGH